MASGASFTLLRRRHFVPETGGPRTCTLDIFRVTTPDGQTGTAARVRYFEESKGSEVPDGWRNPVVQSLPQDDELYLTKFIDRFAEQKKSTGFVDGASLNRDRPVACRVADELGGKKPSSAKEAPKGDASKEAENKPNPEKPKSTHPKAKTDIPIEKVAKCFNLPIHLAADKLRVGETWLKQKCREHNIKRWPYRKVKSIERSIEKLRATIKATSDPVEQADLQRNLEDLKKHHASLLFRKTSSTPPASPLKASNSNNTPETSRSSMSTQGHFTAGRKDTHVVGVMSPAKQASALGKRGSVDSWGSSNERSPGTSCTFNKPLAFNKHLAGVSNLHGSPPRRNESIQNLMPCDEDLFALEDVLGF